MLYIKGLRYPETADQWTCSQHKISAPWKDIIPILFSKYILHTIFYLYILQHNSPSCITNLASTRSILVVIAFFQWQLLFNGNHFKPVSTWYSWRVYNINIYHLEHYTHYSVFSIKMLVNKFSVKALSHITKTILRTMCVLIWRVHCSKLQHSCSTHWNFKTSNIKQYQIKLNYQILQKQTDCTRCSYYMYSLMNFCCMSCIVLKMFSLKVHYCSQL